MKDLHVFRFALFNVGQDSIDIDMPYPFHTHPTTPPPPSPTLNPNAKQKNLTETTMEIGYVIRAWDYHGNVTNTITEGGGDENKKINKNDVCLEI